MIFLVIQWLEELLGHRLPSVFLYTSTRMILAAITALLISIFLGPWFIRKLYALKVGQPIRTEDSLILKELHQKKEATPTMGGILMLSAAMLSMFFWMDLSSIFTLMMLLTLIVFGTLGGYDDYLKIKKRNSKGLSAKRKLIVQVAFSLSIAAYFYLPLVREALTHGNWFAAPHLKWNGQSLPFAEFAASLYIPFIKGPLVIFSGIGLLIAILLIFFVITGSSNAVNLTDGLDGLATGCLILVACCFALIAFLSNHSDLANYLNIVYIEGSSEIAVFLSGLIGACLGFLWYNGHPAQVFMGDIGSLTLGGIIGVVAVLLKREALLALVGGVFVAEALSVILQVVSYRLRNKKRIFLCAPLHHHFEFQGMAETKVVLRFWIIGLLLAIVGIASLKFQ